MPGKFSRFVNEHGPAVGEQANKLLKEYGPGVAWKILDKAAKSTKNPLPKMALGFFRDIVRELDRRSSP